MMTVVTGTNAVSTLKTSCATSCYSIRMLGDFDGAVRVYEQAIEINKARGDVIAVSLSRCHIANVHIDQGRVDAALEVYWQDVRISRESEPPHPSNEAGTLNNMGAAVAKVELVRCSGFPVSHQGSGIATPVSRRAG